jgi:hypothetical protein
MTNKTYNMFLGKQGGTDPTTFIGRVGDIFYDPATGFLRLSDGSTPGGALLNMIGRQGYCGVFYDTTIQTNDNTTNKIRYNTTDISDGISVVANSRITLAHAGRYNIQFSAQLDKTDSGTDLIEIWLIKNGQNIQDSGGIINLVGNKAKTITSWNYVVDALVNDYYELAWYTTDTDVRLFYQTGTEGRPNVPSVIITVTQV